MRLTDGQTDGSTEFSLLDRVYIPCSAVITDRIFMIILHRSTFGQKKSPAKFLKLSAIRIPRPD